MPARKKIKTHVNNGFIVSGGKTWPRTVDSGRRGDVITSDENFAGQRLTRNIQI